MDQSLTFRQHAEKVSRKTTARVNLIHRLADYNWEAEFTTLYTSTLAEYMPLQNTAFLHGEGATTLRR